VGCREAPARSLCRGRSHRRSSRTHIPVTERRMGPDNHGANRSGTGAKLDTGSPWTSLSPAVQQLLGLQRQGSDPPNTPPLRHEGAAPTWDGSPPWTPSATQNNPRGAHQGHSSVAGSWLPGQWVLSGAKPLLCPANGCWNGALYPGRPRCWPCQSRIWPLFGKAGLSLQHGPWDTQGPPPHHCQRCRGLVGGQGGWMHIEPHRWQLGLFGRRGKGQGWTARGAARPRTTPSRSLGCPSNSSKSKQGMGSAQWWRRHREGQRAATSNQASARGVGAREQPLAPGRDPGRGEMPPHTS